MGQQITAFFSSAQILEIELKQAKESGSRLGILPNSR